MGKGTWSGLQWKRREPSAFWEGINQWSCSKQRTACIQSTQLPQGMYRLLSRSSEWQPLSFCSSVTMGMFGTVKSYRGLRNGRWLPPLHTEEEDTGCHGGSGCWAAPFTQQPKEALLHAPPSPGTLSPRLSKWALSSERALGAAPTGPDLDMELGILLSTSSSTTAGVSLPLLNCMKGRVSRPCFGKSLTPW